MRKGCLQVGAPADLIQVIESPPIPKTEVLMRICDLVVATGGAGMVKAAYSSGAPAYGVGVGNAAHVVDETADLDDAAVMWPKGERIPSIEVVAKPPRASPNLPESSLLLIVPFS
jgi:sulfoacetaldehyde dehydrogenase